MGKRKNTRKHKKNKGTTQRNQSAAAPSVSAPPRAKLPQLPLPFPSGLALPRNSFLRNTDPYKESFQTALDTCYEGFVVDMTIEQETEEQVQNALLRLQEQGFFRPDVTQPFGLGTKCAKTYVTRCLLGDQGTTYKYLGLRMFSTSWNDSDDEAVQAIQRLNHVLTKRTEHHLSELDKKKSARGDSTQGRAGFDICLINRMTHSPDLKEEPSLGQGKCAVSWHADSSLEHYSTIAVYQTIVNNNKSGECDDWSVALRVAHHAEGPESSRGLRTDIQSTLVADAPTVSVSLPSGSTYYLLDDFNHHHQHAVVSQSGNNSDSIRYSCTHRLLRQSHNVNFMLERCQKTCSLFHKKGSKIWRSEQLLLTELESEWIRQFYIQGQQHYDLLWKHWGDSIQRLLRYWSQLEARTKQTIDLLQLAAEARCELSDGPPSSKIERKRRDKRKKALDTVEELISRIGTARTTAIQSLYEPFADLLRERAEMRRLWKKRQEDHVFRELDRSQRPLPIPFEYGTDAKSNGGEFAVSPMPEDLVGMADRLVALGRAFVSEDAKYLPEDCKLNDAHPTVRTDSSTKEAMAALDEHCQPLNWNGWSSRQFGLEMQDPWAGLLLQKRKTIETRAYDLPPALLGRRIEILQSQKGGITSSLGNVVQMAAGESPVTRVGWCTFTNVIRYEDADLFNADQDAHWVTKGSDFHPFNTRKGKKHTAVYGWVVGEVGTYANETPRNPLKAIVRRYRSLFELQISDSNSKQASTTLRKRKKRRRY